jgi:hypothetical protein
MNDRERIQATSLKEQILDHDPKAKIVVHVGYAHLSEKVFPIDFGGAPGDLVMKGEIRPMAVRLRDLTGINPLTVDQTSRTEHSAPEHEHPAYRDAIDTRRVRRRSLVFQNKRGEFYLPAGARGVYDLMVYHPRSRSSNGRATWRSLSGTRTAHHLPRGVRPPPGAHYLAQAFYAHEPIRVAVPVDQIELRAEGPIPALLLPRHGLFTVRVVDAAGNTVREYRCRRDDNSS